MCAKLDEIIGQLERVTYYNEETTYAVLKVKVKGHHDLVTVVGNILSPILGEILHITGEWTSHPQFGKQFKAVSCKSSVPTTIMGIEKYLGGGLIKGIGPVMAKRIIEAFGDKTLEIIEESPDKLCTIEGIGKHRVKMIFDAWKEQKEIRSVMIFLQSHGVSSAYASKIYKKYGNESIAIVKENPYRLSHDIWGVGFVTADKIAQNLGFDAQSTQRAEAGIMFILQHSIEEGHVFIEHGTLLARASQLLQTDDSIILDSIQNLQNSGKIYVEEINDDDISFTAVYLSGYRLAEVRTASKLQEIYNTPTTFNKFYADSCIQYAQGRLQLKLAEKQIEAVKSAITNKITVITGGPGTGKTTITKAILEIFSLATNKIVLAAPTGRAAKRMTETTGKIAKTIHRLLEFNPADGAFKRNSENPLECEVIIIDEASMIDNLLAYHLLKAIPEHAIVIFIGDTNQLPSVGAGNVLHDIIASQAYPVIELNEIFRQAGSSQIIVNAHRIICGENIYVNNSDNTDFFFIEEEESERVIDKILLMVSERIPQKFGFDPMQEIQVLSPMNRGSLGTIRLNEALQNKLNPDGTEINRNGQKYRVGDKVMQIRNNYDKNTYNGDIGFVHNIDLDNQIVQVSIDENIVNYEFSELDELVLAYSISIHKSQGSEYPAVVIPLSMHHYMMLQRNLLYTGITRGKKLVVIIGSPNALQTAIQNNTVATRNTRLKQRIKDGFNSPMIDF